MNYIWYVDMLQGRSKLPVKSLFFFDLKTTIDNYFILPIEIQQFKPRFLIMSISIIDKWLKFDRQIDNDVQTNYVVACRFLEQFNKNHIAII